MIPVPCARRVALGPCHSDCLGFGFWCVFPLAVLSSAVAAEPPRGSSPGYHRVASHGMTFRFLFWASLLSPESRLKPALKAVLWGGARAALRCRHRFVLVKGRARCPLCVPVSRTPAPSRLPLAQFGSHGGNLNALTLVVVLGGWCFAVCEDPTSADEPSL